MSGDAFRIGYPHFLRVHGLDQQGRQSLPASMVLRWIRTQFAAYLEECPDTSFHVWLLDRFPVEVTA